VTSYNWGYLNTSNTTPLATDGDILKDRVLVQYNPEDTEYDATLQYNAQDASNLIDQIVQYYTAIIPVTDPRSPAYWKTDTGGVSNCPLLIRQACADFAASFFKRRLFPSEVHLKIPTAPADSKKSELNSSYWYSMGLSKIQQYIESNYKKPRFHMFKADNATDFGGIGGYREIE
jgi:hypothetical protein